MSVEFNRDVQRHDALLQANIVRLERARIKRRIRSRDVSIADVLESPDESLLSMPVRELLLCVPKLGPDSVRRCLLRAGVPLLLPVGRLTDRQVAKVLFEIPAARRLR